MKNNLGELLKTHNITQVTMGEHLGVSFQQIQKYSSGLNDIPLSKAIKICEYFNITLDKLLPELEETLKNNDTDIPKKTYFDHSKHTNNNVVNHNYNGTTASFWHFIKNIKTADFDTIKANLIKLFTVLLGIIIITRLVVFYSRSNINESVVIAHLTSGMLAYGILIGFVLPLLVKTMWSYVPLISGLASILFLLETLLTGNSVSGTFTRISVWTIAIILTISYSFLVKYLKTRNINNESNVVIDNKKDKTIKT